MGYKSEFGKLELTNQKKQIYPTLEVFNIMHYGHHFSVQVSSLIHEPKCETGRFSILQKLIVVNWTDVNCNLFLFLYTREAGNKRQNKNLM